jgi:flagellar biosynthetic protein FlhB
MSDERTEKATPRRREEARRRGQIAKSVEINSAALMLTAFWLLKVIGPRFYEGLTTAMQRTFAELPGPDLTLEELSAGGLAASANMLWTLAPFVLPLVVVGVVVNLAQVGLLFSGKVLQPDLNKLNPINGAKRLVSLRGVVDLLKSLIKVTVVGTVIFITLRDNYATIVSTSRMDLSNGAVVLAELAIEIGLRVAMIMVVIGILDYIYQRYEHEKNLRMSKQEIKEEQKQMENPQLKGRIRSRQRQLAMSRMMAAIPQADVVITNPTHFAVALKYQQGKMFAPQVVAKGQRLVAQRIKERAREHNVPLVENKPLARTLFKAVEVGQSIPAEMYQAVAEVLAFVYRLKSARPGAKR